MALLKTPIVILLAKNIEVVGFNEGPSGVWDHKF